MLPKVKRGVLTWVRKQLSFVVILAAILFLSAGTVGWTVGWIYLALTVLVILVDVIVLLPEKADLLAERSELQEGTKAWDIWLASLAAIVFPIATWIVAGLDERNGWSSVATSICYRCACISLEHGCTVAYRTRSFS